MALHQRRHLPSYLALLLAFLLPPLAASQWQRCGDNGNFTVNSTYQANIQALSVALPKNASSSRTLFAAASVGTLPNIVYALALCRGDANASTCGDCVSKGFQDAQQLCPYSKDATVYYDDCYLRFSNQNFLSATGGDNVALILTNTQNVTAPFTVFDAAVGVLINATADYAAQNSSRRFGTGEKGFETFDKGKPKIYGLAQCRPDMAPADCRSCLAGIITYIPQSMSGKQGGRILGVQCNYRYEQYSFFTGPSLLQLPAPSVGAAPAPLNATPVSPPPPGGVPGAWFSAATAAILTAVVDHAVAAAGNSTARRYFATGEVDLEPKIYALAQCLPDMTLSQCQSCFGTLVDQTRVLLVTTKPRWINSFTAWCNLRYSVQPFYEGRSMLELQAPPPPSAVPPSVTPESGGAGKKRSAAGISAGIGCSVVLILVVSVLAFVGCKRRTKATKDNHPLNNIVGAQCTIFDLPTLQEATENFSEKNKLGEGGFGIVYKGILPDGQEIAVKKLLGTTGRGLQELHNEVLLLAELQHKNLVRLQGFCSHRDDTLLVYEYIKNGSLDNFLFVSGEEHSLNWEQRYNIILGIAKGILYLHEDSSMRIIHRDLKPNNILLDDDMDPKIADFGLARLLGEGHTHTKTARAAGTLGYMAPEAVHGRVSPKIDIYSFGVLVLEIVTRRRNSSSGEPDTVNLLSDVWNCWTKGTISEMIDQSLDQYAQSQALRCIHIGLMCVQPDPDVRPYILSVIFMLTRDNMEIQAPAQPAFFFRSESALASLSSYDQSDFILGENASLNGITITELYPR